MAQQTPAQREFERFQETLKPTPKGGAPFESRLQDLQTAGRQAAFGRALRALQKAPLPSVRRTGNLKAR